MKIIHVISLAFTLYWVAQPAEAYTPADLDCNHCVTQPGISCNQLGWVDVKIGVKNNTFDTLSVNCYIPDAFEFNQTHSIEPSGSYLFTGTGTGEGYGHTGCPIYSGGLVTCVYTNSSSGISGSFTYPSTVADHSTPPKYPHACPTPTRHQGPQNAYLVQCAVQWYVCSRRDSVETYFAVNARPTYLFTWNGMKTSIVKGQLMANKLALDFAATTLYEVTESTYNPDTGKLTMKLVLVDQDPFKDDNSTQACAASIGL